uniref:Orofacial cleft 1 candidate 1 n=1 Tax=Labrus bergylta TaxID=56723 RepID=A0A3Q3GT59_9LABR
IHLTISLQKLQQKALQQPKQKKSKSAEFLMGGEERTAVVGIDNPAFDGGGSAELSVSSLWLGREIRGDRPDSTLAAHPKKMELQAPAKERGNNHTQNYFDPLSAEQTDPRHHRMTGVSAEDELELTMLDADENRLYQRMAALLDEDDTFINIPGTLLASRDEEVLEVKAGDPVLQRRLLLHSGGDASGSRPSQAHTIAKTQAGAGAGLGGEAGLEAGRMVMGRESTVKMRTAKEAIPRYAQQLRERVRPDMITLGSLSLQQVRSTKRNICVIIPYSPAHHQTIESPSLRALGEGQEEAIAKYGQMTELQESSSSASRPLWQLNQSTTSQPVEVCVRCLRATRDKLPRGLYSVSVGLHSRLGGQALDWCSKKEQQQWAVSTEPMDLFVILPAACEVVPSMVLVFQLIALPGHRSHVSSVIAWGAFPVCGLNLGQVQGRFKTPLLRGEPNRQVDRFKEIEALISSDLDHWLCNLYFQIKRFPSGGPERCITLSIPSANHQPVVQYDQPQGQLPPQPQPLSQTQLRPHFIHPQSQLNPQQQPHAGPSSRAGEPAVVHSHRGSPLHLSADSACSSSSLPGRGPMLKPPNYATVGRKCHPNKKPIKKTNSCGPSMSGSSAPPRQADKQKMQNLSAEEMEEYTFSLQSALPGPVSRPSRLSDRACLALRMLPSQLGLPLPGQQQPHRGWRGSVRQLGLIMLLLALMWFVRLYLHYCSQWLYLQAIAVPVNKFQFHAHTVDLVYQGSLLHTREELAMVVVGPLTLNAVTFLLVLIRWGCQQIFGSLPSFTSKFIMAQGVWTVLDPLAVFAVDAVLGRLAYSPDTPVGDAAKLYWHFYRTDQSGAAGVIITLFLYAVLFLLSITILSIYLLRFHNNGRMLDVFQRLTAKEGTYFLPEDLELSNQELSYIVKKAEQWRGFNGERRKVAVYDYIWTAEDPSAGSAPPSEYPREGRVLPEGDTSTHVTIYTLNLSGRKQRYRHFLRQPDGAIIEVIGDMEGFDNSTRIVSSQGQGSADRREHKEGESVPLQLRKRRRLFGSECQPDASPKFYSLTKTCFFSCMRTVFDLFSCCLFNRIDLVSSSVSLPQGAIVLSR